MTQPITLLDSNKHGDLKIDKVDFGHLADQHIVPVTLHEIGRAAIDYPVVFVKNSETGEFQSVAMLGLKPGQNLMVKGGQWQSLYQPHVVRDYPLGVVLDPDDKDKVWIGIREASSAVGTEEGEALFNGTEETDYLAARKKALIEHFQQDQASRTLVKVLADLDLFLPQTLTVEIKGEKRNINGIYLINEAKLNDLSDEQFSDLRKRGLLAPIFSHLTSLGQINRLARTEAQA
ncbi:MAG: SapC family protein [Shewanella sp.]|nr:SapC family protein [Shewanella sp.]MCF1431456.1 SapC family protein [Shewanella sp.]MCF1439571.1 SapC family protein [Shewanella sp.]MCF1457202.1 SapC family protein [Shewanella sp.]